jgi:hypothetical protein
MILDLLAYLRRVRRYREVSNLIMQTITEQSQLRVDKSLSEAYLKAHAAGASEEQMKGFDQKFIDLINEKLSAENAVRIRQWTNAILNEEDKT